MNLSAALMELREREHLVGVYKDLINHLESVKDGGEKIPIFNSTEEFVDDGYIEEVLEELVEKVEALLVERNKIMEWEVINDQNQDAGGDGSEGDGASS